MAETKIEWADYTFNPWMGCTKVSPACANCYAERDMDKRLNKVAWGNNGTRVKTSTGNWQKPHRWNREAMESGGRKRVFCASLADVFEDWNGPIHDHNGKVQVKKLAPFRAIRPLTMDGLRRDLFELIDDTPYLDWLLLTKRPENIRRMWPRYSFDACATGDCPHWYSADCEEVFRRDNVWIGTSVENQEQADKRIPLLLECRDLSPALFLSCEPLLGPLDLPWLTTTGHALPTIDWVIAGGESGPKARPSHPDWFRSLRDQCYRNGIPFLFKQWGEWQNGSSPSGLNHIVLNDGRHGASIQEIGWSPAQPNASSKWHALKPTSMSRVGKKEAGRVLDGNLWNQFPNISWNQNSSGEGHQ